MNSDMIVITINGTDYYVPVDYAEYIVQVGDTLTLTKSGSCTLYSRLGTYNGGNVAYYPQITLQFGRTGRYVTSNGTYGTNTSELVVSDMSYKYDVPLLQKNWFISVALICVLGVMLWRSLSR